MAVKGWPLAVRRSSTASRPRGQVIAVAGPVAATSQNFPLPSAYLAVSAIRCATGRLPWNRHTGSVFYSRPAHSRTWVGQKGRLLPRGALSIARWADGSKARIVESWRPRHVAIERGVRDAKLAATAHNPAAVCPAAFTAVKRA